ncbi:MAG: glutamine--tRNA ligase/YqeY domain fusion protein [Myxococcales bacterium]|nr:glutamine--tRNA ligase/YqeY domain fusion protein [Myxococcales bacterium]
MPDASDTASDNAPNFIHEHIEAELASDALAASALCTRFPPEPNGYLHIGHVKAIWVSFGTALKYGGRFNLRLDDTNPIAEEAEFVEAIQQDVRWLGYDWSDRLFFASDYYEQLYLWAEQLIEAGKAYVDESSLEQIRTRRGDFYHVGEDSPYRERPAAESLDLFRRMRAGEFPDGAMVLRAKIDMAHKNLNMRDPPMYRILHARHHRTGASWCIYPMYDFAHGQSDAIEGISHSLCTLEFEDHRPLYDWFIEALGLEPRPRQIEFAKLLLSHTVLSKRRLRQLVEQGHVAGWDDPRMPTIAGMRRRGFSAEALLSLCERVGVSKRDAVVDIELFEHLQREHLNTDCPRAMAVLRPLKLVITNYPEQQEESFEAQNHPEYPEQGTRSLPFCRELYVEREDFREQAPKKWFRLAPGREVRLRYACLVTCQEVIRDEDGEPVELRCSWDPTSRGGTPADGRKVRGTLHWVSARHAVDAEMRLYDRLFSDPDPLGAAGDGDFTRLKNAGSLEVLRGVKLEPALEGAPAGARYQFERLGYFAVDPDSTGHQPVWNRTLTLRDSWAKLEKKQRA